jgi:NitT/TauT family transport system substrate-binding protein
MSLPIRAAEARAMHLGWALLALARRLRPKHPAIARRAPMVGRRHLILGAAALAAPRGIAAQGSLDRVSLQTNWRAQAEHGGFYQAAATGLYRQAGLDVEIRMGGPQINNAQLLIAGRCDFSLSNALSGLQFARDNLPFLTVAAIFQKDPVVLISHPGVVDQIAQMRGRPILISGGGRLSFWPFLRARFGFTDEQIRPYTFTIAPFLNDRNTIQQGFLTSEPFAMRQAGADPRVHLLAEHAYDNYQTTIETSRRMIETRGDLVRRFVDASILGWRSYLHGDPAPANALIQRDNPDQTPERLDYAREAMRERGLVESGDADAHGIGAMTAERWASLHRVMAEAGAYPAGMDVARAYTLEFVNRRVGMGA